MRVLIAYLKQSKKEKGVYKTILQSIMLAEIVEKNIARRTSKFKFAKDTGPQQRLEQPDHIRPKNTKPPLQDMDQDSIRVWHDINYGDEFDKALRGKKRNIAKAKMDLVY